MKLTTVAEAVKWADVVMVLVPDQTAAKLYAEEIGPNIKPGTLLMFAHGFNIHFKTIVPAAGIDVGMAAPKAPAVAYAYWNRDRKYGGWHAGSAAASLQCCG